jgi:hypothetical protein
MRSEWTTFIDQCMRFRSKIRAIRDLLFQETDAARPFKSRRILLFKDSKSEM